MKKQMLTGIMVAFALCASFTSPAIAQQYSGYGDEWQHSIAIYGWGTDIGGRTASGTGISIGFDDIVDKLDFAFMGGYQARKGRWSILTDVFYADLSDDRQLDVVPLVGGGMFNVSTQASLDMETTVVQAGVGYNLYNREKTTADVVFGVRYLDLSTDLVFQIDLPPPELEPTVTLSESGDLWDAVIGLNGRIRIGNRWFLPYHLDVGGGDSDLTWQAMAGISYQASDWADIILAYRYLAWDIGGEVVDDLDLSGPGLGVIFRF